jgi:uncharacterized membrane protein
MNTFFKLHMQAWLLLSIASGIAIASLAARWRSARPAWAWRAAFAAATLVALAYLPLAIVGRSHARFDPGARLSLDGEAFLDHAVYVIDGHPLRLAADKRIIEWMRANAGLDDVVLEAQLPEYRWGGRISVFTSRPTVLGYRFHESQQRPISALGDAIELRRRNVEAIYASTDAKRAMSAVRHYGVRFIVVGALERATYPAPGLAKFATLAQRGKLHAVFTSGDDVIYRVPDDGSRKATPAW